MKKERAFSVFMILLIGIFLFAAGFVSGASCCERTTAGAWCQTIEKDSDCAVGYRNVPTSCEATSYCRTGTCINTLEGTCIESPRVTCENNGGSWNEKKSYNIPQCQLGCCLIGEQAAFVTQVRCERLSSLYGLTTNYRKDITTEMECAASANPTVKGACVYEQDSQRKCQMKTKRECNDMKASFADVEFHEGYLCSAEVLETVCGPRGGTTCVEEKDAVYFLDTCGNVANIYDYSKLNNERYWTFIEEPSCDNGNGNKGSATCGKCDYYSGSTCKKVKTGESVSYGDNICRDLDCKDYRGDGFTSTNYPRHGETWCASSKGVGKISGTSSVISGGSNYLTENLPGSRYYRMICYNGEVTVDACADYRAEVCIQSEIGTTKFKNAVCRKNLWEFCSTIKNKEDCEDREKADCRWIQGKYYFPEGSTMQNSEITDENSIKGVCIPLYAPGFDIDNSNSNENGVNICGIASTSCVVSYEEGLFDGDWFSSEIDDLDKLSLDEKKDYCEENCECLDYAEGDTGWKDEINSICTAMGDCGVKVNFIKVQGKSYTPVTTHQLD